MHQVKLLSFLNDFRKLSPKATREYIVNIKPKELNYISEVCKNFLANNINIDLLTLTKLKRLRQSLHVLASKQSRSSLKKRLLRSIQGGRILSLVIPLAIKSLLNL